MWWVVFPMYCLSSCLVMLSPYNRSFALLCPIPCCHRLDGAQPHKLGGWETRPGQRFFFCSPDKCNVLCILSLRLEFCLCCVPSSKEHLWRNPTLCVLVRDTERWGTQAVNEKVQCKWREIIPPFCLVLSKHTRFFPYLSPSFTPLLTTVFRALFSHKDMCPLRGR